MSFFSKERLRSPILPKSAFLYFHTHSDCTAEAERLRDYKHVWAAPPFYGTGCPSHTERSGSGKMAEVPFEKHVAVVR